MTSSAGLLTNTESITGNLGSAFPDGFTLDDVVVAAVLATPGAIQTGTSSADTVVLQAYDVNASAYQTMIGLTAANTPTLTLGVASGDGTLTVQSDLTMTDAKNIVLTSATGTKIGTSATTQKLGFFNATPVVQPTSANQSALVTTAVTTAAGIYGFSTAAQALAIATFCNQVRTDLVALGLIKGS